MVGLATLAQFLEGTPRHPCLGEPLVFLGAPGLGLVQRGFLGLEARLGGVDGESIGVMQAGGRRMGPGLLLDLLVDLFELVGMFLGTPPLARLVGQRFTERRGLLPFRGGPEVEDALQRKLEGLQAVTPSSIGVARCARAPTASRASEKRLGSSGRCCNSASISGRIASAVSTARLAPGL